MQSDTPEQYAGPLAELSQLLVQQLAPAALSPQDPGNLVLLLEKRFYEGVAELERGGYTAEGISTFQYWYKLDYLEKHPAAG